MSEIFWLAEKLGFNLIYGISVGALVTGVIMLVGSIRGDLKHRRATRNHRRNSDLQSM